MTAPFAPHLRFSLSLVTCALLASPVAAQVDGSLDTTFGAGGQLLIDLSTSPGDEVTQGRLSAGPGNALSVGFSFYDSSALNTDFGVCRLSASGVLADCTTFAFDLGGGNTDSAYGIATQADGRRVLGGKVRVAADSAYELGFLGLTQFDVIDSAFGGGDGRAVTQATDVAIVEDLAARRTTDIVFAAYYHHEATTPGASYDCLAGRMLADGTLDASFDGNGLAYVGWDGVNPSSDRCAGVALYPDGRVVVAGDAADFTLSSDFAVARFTTGGALDTNFSGNGKQLVAFDLGGTNSDVGRRVRVDHRNRIVVAGTADTASGKRAAVVRIPAGGGLDTTFNGTGKLAFTFGAGDDIAEVEGLAILPPPSNDIAVAGTYVDAVSGDKRGFVALLHDNGSFDTSFNGTGKKGITLTGADSKFFANGLAVGDGRITLSGDFPEGSPSMDSLWLVRLNRHAIFGDDFESGDLRLWSNYGDP